MNHKYLEAGKIVSTHGIHGEIKLLPWADSPEFLLPFRTFYLPGNRAVTVESSRVHGSCVLLKLEGIDTPEAAGALKNQILSISREDAALPKDKIFIADLIDLPVRAKGVEIGRIKEVLTMPSSDVYVIRGEHEYMIPAVKAFVPEIDPAKGYIEVNLIEGMRTDAD